MTRRPCDSTTTALIWTGKVLTVSRPSALRLLLLPAFLRLLGLDEMSCSLLQVEIAFDSIGFWQLEQGDSVEPHLI